MYKKVCWNYCCHTHYDVRAPDVYSQKNNTIKKYTKKNQIKIIHRKIYKMKNIKRKQIIYRKLCTLQNLRKKNINIAKNLRGQRKFDFQPW